MKKVIVKLVSGEEQHFDVSDENIMPILFPFNDTLKLELLDGSVTVFNWRQVEWVHYGDLT